MVIREIEAKSILRKRRKIDSWFISRCGMNLYRGCMHNCVYCDGRSEGYYVDGLFGKDVEVKINAIEVLQQELDSKRKYSSFKPSYVMIGGGVGDSYQPVEKKYELTQKTLELLYDKQFPVHILTKSTLVKRDIDIIERINQQSRAIVSFSFSSTDDKISSIFEPGVPSPSKRLKTMEFFKKQGIACGMFMLPVIPFITDKPNIMNETVRKAKEVGADFIIFGGMTLKDGRQKEYFLNVLEENYPKLLVEYNNIYKGDKWGNAINKYYQSINTVFSDIVKNYNMPKRIPLPLFKDILDENDLVIVILEHIDYLLKLRGQFSPYGYAAYYISKLSKPLSTMKSRLREIKGVGKTTERIILEILETKSSSYYEKLSKS